MPEPGIYAMLDGSSASSIICCKIIGRFESARRTGPRLIATGGTPFMCIFVSDSVSTLES
jgi:hypothetical protein